MTEVTVRSRGRRLVVLLAGAVAALAVAGTARADIAGKVTTPGGVPVPGVGVALNDANGRIASFDSTEADGTYRFTTSSLSGDTPPFTLSIDTFDSCKSSSEGSEVKVSVPNVVDATVVNIPVDLRDFCVGSAPSSAPPATGLIDLPTRHALVPPGGVVYYKAALVPSGATGIQVLLSDRATVVGSSADTFSSIPVTAPAAGYDGPLVLRYAVNGVTVDRDLGTLTARAISPPVPLPGPIDLEAIVDISGSMSGNDPKFVRRDALNLLVDLARPGDRLGAVSFDDKAQAIFAPTVITGTGAVGNALKAAAKAGVINRGGTDYNAGFDAAQAALTTTPGIDPNRQKGVIFLTDGGHNVGDYLNGHLRFAYNASGRPWPVCSIQLGAPSSFQPDDVARLKRIASETGGRYFAVSVASQLTDIYFKCFGITTGQRTLANKTFTFRAGQKRTFRQTLPKGLGSATFFVSGSGVYSVTLTDPKGRVHTITRPLGKGFSFRRGATFAFVRVTKPLPGKWTASLSAVRLTSPTDRARATVTVPKK
jgi:VWA domain-containing protein